MKSGAISLREEAYKHLKSLRSGDKTFSDVFMEITGRGGGFEQLKELDVDYSVDELIKDRREDSFTDEATQDVLR